LQAFSASLLTRRGRVFWVRRTVPGDLTRSLGHSDIRRSLRTSDPRVAMQRAWSLMLVIEECRAVLEATAGPEAASQIKIIAELGDPAPILAKLVFDRDIDLVVTGTYGRSGLMDALLGSTAMKIMAQVSCDVLVVRRKARPESLRSDWQHLASKPSEAARLTHRISLKFAAIPEASLQPGRAGCVPPEGSIHDENDIPRVYCRYGHFDCRARAGERRPLYYFRLSSFR